MVVDRDLLGPLRPLLSSAAEGSCRAALAVRPARRQPAREGSSKGSSCPPCSEEALRLFSERARRPLPSARPRADDGNRQARDGKGRSKAPRELGAASLHDPRPGDRARSGATPGSLPMAKARRREGQQRERTNEVRYLVDPASSYMLVSKIKPCKCKHESRKRRGCERLIKSVVVYVVVRRGVSASSKRTTLENLELIRAKRRRRLPGGAHLSAIASAGSCGVLRGAAARRPWRLWITVSGSPIPCRSATNHSSV